MPEVGLDRFARDEQGLGGVNAVVAVAVLAGVIRPAAGYDAVAMMGRAYVWDTLFSSLGHLPGPLPLALAAELRARPVKNEA